MQFHQIKTDVFTNAEKELQQNRAAGEWLKLPQGPSQLRIAPPWSEEGAPFRKNVNHNDFTVIGNDGEAKKVAPTCLDYIFTSKALTGYLKEAKKITKEDFVLWQKHGCPICKLGEQVKILRGVDAAKPFFNKISYIWNIVNRQANTLHKWSTSKKFTEAVFSAYQMFQQNGANLFDPMEGFDFAITRSGEGKGTRYTAPMFLANKPTPLGYTGPLYNLDDAVAQGVRSFNEIVQILITNEHSAPLMKLLGITFSN